MNRKEFFLPTPGKIVLTIWLMFVSFAISLFLFNSGFCDFTFDCGGTYGMPLPVYVREAATTRYLFNWDDVPGKDNEKLIDFLKNGYEERAFTGMYGKDRVNIEKIEKTDNNTINVFYENMSISMILNDRKDEINLTIHAGRAFSIDRMGINYKNGGIYGMAFAEPRIYYHSIILQIIFWYVLSCYVIGKRPNAKPILKTVLLCFEIFGGFILILGNLSFAILIIILISINYYLKKMNYDALRDDFRFSMRLTLIIYPWLLLLGLGSTILIYKPISVFLIPCICIMTGSLARIKNKFLLGLTIGAIPYSIQLMAHIILYSTNMGSFLPSFIAPSFNELIKIGLLFGTAGAVLGSAGSKIKDQ